jgi:hypothetical protein
VLRACRSAQTLALLFLLLDACWPFVPGGGAGGGGAATSTGPGKGPGEACETDSQCSSDACAGGYCCLGTCPAQDAGTCGTTGMCAKATGACLKYDAGTPCAEASCSSANSMMVMNTQCDGDGNCAGGTPQPCPGHLSCADSTSCNPVCGAGASADDMKCIPGWYCDGNAAGACQPKKVSGSACSAGDECASDICGASGAGHCCVTGCSTDPTCGATDCDSVGACVYPSTASCGMATCVNNATSSTQTDVGMCSDGVCVPTQKSCNSFKCNTNPNTNTCSSTCTTNSDCWSYHCVDGGNNTNVCCTASDCGNYACTLVGTCAESCMSNDDCSSSKSCMGGTCQ